MAGLRVRAACAGDSVLSSVRHVFTPPALLEPKRKKQKVSLPEACFDHGACVTSNSDFLNVTKKALIIKTSRRQTTV